MLWTGPTNGSGYPMVSVERKNRPLRTIMAELMQKQKQKHQVMTTTCKNISCINPEHLRVANKSSVLKMSHERYNDPIRAAKISAHARATKAKLTIEQARDIRVSEKTHRELALEYGVNKATIGNIKAGRTWKETGSLWRGL